MTISERELHVHALTTRIDGAHAQHTCTQHPRHARKAALPHQQPLERSSGRILQSIVDMHVYPEPHASLDVSLVGSSHFNVPRRSVEARCEAREVTVKCFGFF